MDKVYINLKDYEYCVPKKVEQLKKDFISIDDLLRIIDDYEYEYEYLIEEYEQLKVEIQDNYKMKSPYELYGVSESDFH